MLRVSRRKLLRGGSVFAATKLFAPSIIKSANAGFILGKSGGGGGGGYVAGAGHFDGTAWLERGAALTGASGAYTQCLASRWFKIPNTDSFTMLSSQPNGFFFENFAQALGNIWLANLYDADFNGDILKANTAVISDAWFNILWAYDSSDDSKCRMLLNGTDVTQRQFFNTGLATLAGETNFFVGTSNGDPGFVGDASDFYTAFDQWLDLTNPANAAKFIDSNGKPVDLGADGSSPTGVAPTIFFSGNADTFATNKGTGGSFTLTGTLTNATTSPSD